MIAFITSCIACLCLGAPPSATVKPAVKSSRQPQIRRAADVPFHTQGMVHTIRLEMLAKDWFALQPTPAPGFMENNFPDQPATLTVDGRPLSVSTRFKGNGTFMMSGAMVKKPFKITLDKRIKDQNIQGITTINLGNNVMDATGIREALAYTVFSKLGVPCSRNTFASVTIDVPGVVENRSVGLYSIPEQVDAHFFARHFTKPVTLVLKPENAAGLPRFDSWKAYEKTYDAKGKPTEEDKQRFMEFVSFVHSSTGAEFASKLSDYLDVDSFARFMAGTVATSSLDSILLTGHNYYIIRNPDTGRFQFLPWDLDLAFGAFPMSGVNGLRLSVLKPYGQREFLLRRFLSVPAARILYENACKEAAHILKSLEPLRAQLEKLVAPTVAKNDFSSLPGMMPNNMFSMPSPGPSPASISSNDRSVYVLKDGKLHQFASDGLTPVAKVALPAQGMPADRPENLQALFGGMSHLKTFIQQRPEIILNQLSGTAQGEQPRDLMGGPGAFDVSDTVSKALGKLLETTFVATSPAEWNAAWGSFFKRIDTNQDHQIISAEWSRATTLSGDMFAQFLPSQIWAALGGKTRPIIELTKTMDTWFRSFDANRDKLLSSNEVGDGLMAILPPPGFGGNNLPDSPW